MNKPTILFFTLALLGFFATAQTYTLESSEVTISGTSSLHDWESEVTQVDFQGSFTFINEQLSSAQRIQVRIPVRGIRSTKGRVMDRKTYNAFDADSHPDIVFSVNSLSLLGAPAATHTVVAEGSLSMAGTTQPVEVAVTIETLADGFLRVSGEKALLMTSFGMDPPTALLGTLKTGDEVVIHFDLTLSPTPN